MRDCSGSWADGVALEVPPGYDADALDDAMCAFAGLREAAASHRIVCAGEEDHGVSQTRPLNGLLARYLALEHGMRTISIEATEASMEAWDRYMETGAETDLNAGFQDSAGSLGDSQEMEALIRFLREVSMELPAGERLRITGFDVAVQASATRTAILSFIERVDASQVSDWRNAFSRTNQTAMAESATELLAQLDANETDYVAATSEADVARARRDVMNLRDGFLFVERFQAGDFWTGNATYREPGMIRNIEDMLAREPGPVMIIAHNAHCSRDLQIGTDIDGNPSPAFGTHLAESEAWGADYLVVAQLYGRGSRRLPNGTLDEFVALTQSPEGQIAGVAGDAPAFLLSAESAQVDFLTERPSTLRLSPYVFADHYDGVLWVRDVTSLELR